MPNDAPTLSRIRTDLDRLADLLTRLRAYLRTDGEAIAPQAKALAAEIDGLLGN